MRIPFLFLVRSLFAILTLHPIVFSITVGTNPLSIFFVEYKHNMYVIKNYLSVSDRSNPLFWRLATLPFRVPSLQPCLTAEFGMGSGVTTASNHQNTRFDTLHSSQRKHRAQYIRNGNSKYQASSSKSCPKAFIGSWNLDIGSSRFAL